MKASSLKEIKTELQELDPQAVHDLCMRLAKYKKENKELLTYLLFEAHDEHGFVEHARDEMELMFEDLPTGNLYYVKKSLRKILRFMNKQIKYSGVKQTELELRIFFCLRVRNKRIPLTAGTVIGNLYQQQYKKIISVLDKMPEDLQADYEREMTTITL